MKYQNANKSVMMNSPVHLNKKPRLDDSFDEWDADTVGNDLWGQGELTAEEFDILEVQATQKVIPDDTTRFTGNYYTDKVDNTEECRKEQYALQGQVKLLSESLDKTVRELNLERLNREQLISQKLEEAKNAEHRLQKEVEKMQTALHFKEQEMKTSQSKICALEQKVKALIDCKDNFDHQSQTSNSVPKNEPNKFLNRFQFGKHNTVLKDSSVQVGEKADVASKYKLPLLSQYGMLKNCDIVSNFLTNRRAICKPKQETLCYDGLSFINSFEAPFTAFASFNAGLKTCELNQYYHAVFQGHISFLQRVSSLTQGKNSNSVNKMKLTVSVKDVSSCAAVQQATLGMEMEAQHAVVTACMKDLHILQLTLESNNKPSNVQQQNVQVLKLLTEPEVAACSSSLFPEEEKMDCSEENNPACLQFLLAFAKPETYPACYSYMLDEIHQALSTLIEWSSRNSKNLDVLVYNLPFQALVSGIHGSKCAILALKLLINLMVLQSFKSLVHCEGCIFTSLATFCQSVSNSMENEYVEAVAAIEDFLGASIASSGVSILLDENCMCSSQLIQGYVIMLWRYHDMCRKATSPAFCIDVLHHGIVLLHLLSTNVSDFREKRCPVEDQYITLICGLSKLGKYDVKLRSIIDLIHDLWDFQDMSDDNDHSTD